MAIDKNIAALLDESAYTVHVLYPDNQTGTGASRGKVYTFVSNIYPKLIVGDTAIVGGLSSYPPVRLHTKGTIKREPRTVSEAETDFIDEVFGAPAAVSTEHPTFACVLVVGVNEDVVIEPDSQQKFRWIVGKVDTAAYDELMKRNAAIEEQVADAYKHNMRRSFKQQILGGLPSDEQQRLLALLTASSTQTGTSQQPTPAKGD